jgi:hypothetical protein
VAFFIAGLLVGRNLPPSVLVIRIALLLRLVQSPSVPRQSAIDEVTFCTGLYDEYGQEENG